jgi:hypothetical protein
VSATLCFKKAQSFAVILTSIATYSWSLLDFTDRNGLVDDCHTKHSN